MENSDNSAQRQSPNANSNSLGTSNNNANANSSSSNGSNSESTLTTSKADPSPETAATSSTSTSTATATTAPAGTAPESIAPSSTQPTSTQQRATASTDAAPTNHGTEFWCHQASFPRTCCQREITPVMMPDPLCPHCYGEFVEKIEADNDPRAFVQTGPQQHPGEGNNSAPGVNEPVNLDDLFRLFQALANPHRVRQQQQQQQQQQPQQQRIPGQMYSTQFIFNSGPTTTTRTFSTSTEPNAPLGQQQPGAGDHQNTQSGQGGQEVHYSTDPAAALSGQGFGGPMPMGGGNAPFLFPMGGGFPPMVGNPGDYAWGQGALDDIITQMMDLQNRQHGPVGATEDAINNIPHHTLTAEELESKLDCSVCKDDFTKEDQLLQLPCKHIFHEDCIKPWLKVSGTCPTCRYSLVEGTNGNNPAASSNQDGTAQPTSSARTDNGGSTAHIPGAFPSSGGQGP
ncbi:hypothetical protein EC968_007973 [Mortierella alpina]|nr:hypothetical protein EC968_007973 [Mortierella alpina]